MDVFPLGNNSCKKKMKKFRIFYDKDAENEWLNKLDEQGLQLKSFKAGMYEFEQGEAGQYYYLVELIDRVNFDMDAYAKALKKAQIDVLAHFGNYVYLRKPRENGPFKVTTPVEDQIAQYNRIGLVFIAMMFVEFVAGLAEFIGGILTKQPLPFCIGAVLIVVGICFLRIVIKIGKKVNKLDGR